MLTRIFRACQDCGVKLQVQEEAGVQVLVLEGEMVTGEPENQLKRQLELARLHGSRVIVDLSAVPYIDSSVLGQLVYGHSQLKKMGGGLRLVGPSKRIRDLLSLTRLITVFEIFEDRPSALRGWTNPNPR